MVLKIGTLDDPSAPDVSPNFEKRVVSGPHGSGGPAPRPNGGVGGPHGSGGPAPQAPRQRRWPSRFGRLHPPAPRNCVHVPPNFEKRVVKK